MTLPFSSRLRRALGLVAAVPIVLAAWDAGSSAAAGVKLVRIGSFDHPLYATAPPGDRHRVFVVEQTGRIRVVRDGRKLATPFLDLRNQVSCCDERGLLSMAFAPDYATSRRFYVDYTDRHGTLVVEEFRADAGGDRTVPGSGRFVLRQAHPETRHNGGLITFGPDGLLYVGWGDGGGSHDRHGSRG